MADIADGARALVTLVAQTVYPNGIGQPSITGAGVRIRQGWPMPAQLDADLANGVVNVSVFPAAVRPVDSVFSKWRVLTPAERTITATLSGQSVTVGGTVSTPQNVSLVVDGIAYPYAVQPADTLASIATALAVLVSADQPATSAGAVVTIPGAKSISPRVGGMGKRIREVRRQEQEYRVTVWASSYDSRDPLAGAVDAALAARRRLILPEGILGTMRSRALSNSWDDGSQKQGLYRRDLSCWVEYPTTEVQEQYEVTQGQVDLDLPGGVTKTTII